MKNISIGQIKQFDITGKDRSQKCFKITTSSYTQAMMYNIWQGTVWAVLESGKRRVLKRVYN